MNTKPYALAFIALSTFAATSTTFAQELKIQNFLAKSEHFGVTSTLIEGDKEVLLVNAQFAAAICKDAGYQTIAGQIEVFARLSILAIGMPILKALLLAIRELGQ